MMHKVAMLYLAIVGVLALCGIVVGKILKKDVLHGGVQLGILNSILLSAVWPITIICIICGLIHDRVDAWKRL